MGYPKTYELDYFISKEKFNLSANEILIDLEKNLARDGYSVSNKGSYLEFRSRAEYKSLLNYFLRNKRDINVPCKIDYTENEKGMNFKFTAYIKIEVLKMLLFLPILFFIGWAIINGVKSGWVTQMFAFGLLTAFFCFINLIQYLGISSYLADLSTYRLFWKYTTKK